MFNLVHSGTFKKKKTHTRTMIKVDSVPLVLQFAMAWRCNRSSLETEYCNAQMGIGTFIQPLSFTCRKSSDTNNHDRPKYSVLFDYLWITNKISEYSLIIMRKGFELNFFLI